jgi:hypothetical protein
VGTAREVNEEEGSEGEGICFNEKCTGGEEGERRERDRWRGKERRTE